MNKYILNTDNYIKHYDAINVGGKAQSLFELKRLSLNIPDFFVITIEAFHEFLCMNRIEQKINELFLHREYSCIRDVIMEQEIPSNIWNEITQAFHSFNMEIVSIRSSAILEDGKLKSFAGQYDSYLSVSFQGLQNSIKKCWASYYNDNAIDYAEQVPVLHGMAVIVQKMIDAEISGIGFSKSPISTAYDDCVLIEAANGVGENIVSGIITPNQYFYSLNEKRILNSVSNNLLEQNVIEVLAKDIYKIRDFYQVEVDTEWCIKENDIFFLQARPITAIEKKLKPYKKTLVRPLPLIRVELYAMGEYEGIKWLTDGQFYFNPLFIYENGRVAIYYNNISQKENPINMYRYLCDHYDTFLEKYNHTIIACEYIEKILNCQQQFVLNDFIEAVLKIYPFSSLGNLAGNLPQFLVGNIYIIFKQFREEKGELLSQAEEYLLKMATKKLKRDDINFYQIMEVFGDIPRSVQQISERKWGYLYFNKILLTENEENKINKYLNQNQIALVNDGNDIDNVDELTGIVAYGGRIKGVVSIISSEKDFHKFNVGDVLVASMTVPKFLPVIKKASAIVTDEGGALCHAAIVARELQIPTIIGTKRATKMLEDGDMVEVDANNAKVKLLKKKHSNNV